MGTFTSYCIIVASSLFMSFIAFDATPQTLDDYPPKGDEEVYVLVPSGGCTGGKIEIGTYKPDLDEIWTRNPRQFVDSCEVLVEKEFTARYRLAARCVTAEGHNPRGPWVRSLSAENAYWPQGCSGDPVARPILPAPPGPPLAASDTYRVLFNEALTVGVSAGVLANDRDTLDPYNLTAELVEDVLRGALIFNPDGSFSYTPETDYVGVDTFSYRARDLDLYSENATVVIHVEDPTDFDELAHFEFNEGMGTIANDSSPQNVDGLISGAVFVADSGDDSAFSLAFDGVDDTVALGFIDIPADQMTIAAWIKPANFNGDLRIVSKAINTSANGHVFMLSTTGLSDSKKIRGRIRIGGATTTLIGNNHPGMDLDKWYHVAMTYDGSMFRVYVDAAVVGEVPLSGDVSIDAVPVAVGSQPPGAGDGFFQGNIDDVRILKRALTMNELETLADK